MDQNEKINVFFLETYSSVTRTEVERERYPLQSMEWLVHLYRIRIGSIKLNVHLFW